MKKQPAQVAEQAQLAGAGPKEQPVPAPRPAASLMLLRQSVSGPEVYMVRRPPRSRFLPNALVFVGGKLEPADSDPSLSAVLQGLTADQAAARLGLTTGALAFYIASLRECFEEAGVLLAGKQPGAMLGDSPELPALRQLLLAQELSFVQLLDRLGVSLALGQLRYLDHWITPEIEPRRYDTRFFACRAPAEQVPVPDPQETTLGQWFSAPELLAQSQAEQVLLAPPTLLLLERLARHQSVDDFLAACPDQPVPAVMPQLWAEAKGERLLLLPGDYRLQGKEQGPLHYVVLRGKHWEHVLHERERGDS